MKYHLEINVCGFNCPIPLLKLKAALNEIKTDEIVKIIASDPMVNIDFGVYCEKSGNVIIEKIEENDKIIFFIQKA